MTNVGSSRPFASLLSSLAGAFGIGIENAEEALGKFIV